MSLRLFAMYLIALAVTLVALMPRSFAGDKPRVPQFPSISSDRCLNSICEEDYVYSIKDNRSVVGRVQKIYQDGTAMVRWEWVSNNKETKSTQNWPVDYISTYLLVPETDCIGQICSNQDQTVTMQDQRGVRRGDVKRVFSRDNKSGMVEVTWNYINNKVQKWNLGYANPDQLRLTQGCVDGDCAIRRDGVTVPNDLQAPDLDAPATDLQDDVIPVPDFPAEPTVQNTPAPVATPAPTPAVTNPPCGDFDLGPTCKIEQKPKPKKVKCGEKNNPCRG